MDALAAGLRAVGENWLGLLVAIAQAALLALIASAMCDGTLSRWFGGLLIGAFGCMFTAPCVLLWRERHKEVSWHRGSISQDWRDSSRR